MVSGVITSYSIHYTKLYEIQISDASQVDELLDAEAYQGLIENEG